MKKIMLVITILFAALGLTCRIGMAAEVDIPFDYYYKTVESFAKADNGNITVEAGQFGVIQTTSSEGNVQDIKHVCYEDIYWLNYIDGEFVAFTDSYKLTSNDGYNWTKTEDINNIEHEKYGVKKRDSLNYTELIVPDSFSRIGHIEMINTLKTNKFFDEKPDGRRSHITIYYTGKEYIKLEDLYYPNTNFDREVYISSDRENWEYIKTYYREEFLVDNASIIFPGINIESYEYNDVQIINTGKEYLVRNIRWDDYANMYKIKHPVLIYDLNFNYIKKVNISDYIVDMSYIDDLYYITTEDSITYKSTDLENWEIVGENIGAPITNKINTIYKTRISIKSKTWDVYHAYSYECPILYENGSPSKNVVEENIVPYGTRVYGDFFICFTNSNGTDKYTDFSKINGLDGKPLDAKRDISNTFQVSFSKDGIYWSTLKLPVKSITSISCTDDSLLLDSVLLKKTFSIKFSDMEEVVPKCDTKVELNNRILGFSQPPVMENDRTLVPMRFLFEQMGADVNWNEETQTATATVPINTDAQMRTFSSEKEKSVTFSIDDTIATVNGETATMDVPARLVNDKTMVPLRFLSENLGYNVEWDEATNTAIITNE